MNNIFYKPNTKTPFTLTENGKVKAETGVTGGELAKILSSIEEHGASNASEISEDTDLRTARVLKALQYLEKQGFVRHMKKNEFEE